MVVNKNALHDIVMTYIPTKKNNNQTAIKKTLPPPIFKGPVPTLTQNASPKKIINVVKQPSTIISKETLIAPKESILSNLNIEQNIKKIRKKKHIEPLEKSTVERLLEHKEKKNFIDNLLSKSEPNSRKISPRSNHRMNSRKQQNYMKKNIIDTKIYDSSEQPNKYFRDVKIKLDSSRKKGGSKKTSKKTKSKSKKNSIKIKKSVPTSLRYDLEKLLNDNYDNIALQRIR